MSCDVNVGANGLALAYVPFKTPAAKGTRQVVMSALSNSGVAGSLNTADWTATFGASDPTNPRIDSVYLILRDSTIDSTGAQDAKLQVVAGVATAGATLDNRTNAGAQPANSILLADVLIPATATTVTTANIRDRRPFGPLVCPPTFSAVDMVPLIPVPGVPLAAGALLGATNSQAAVLCSLPRRILGATKIRWGYKQTVTPTTGTYNIAICDASGRPIQASGAQAFTGAASADVQRSEAIASSDWEPGMYWVLFGQVLTGGASVSAMCANYKSGNAEVVAANMFAYLTAATGTTFPSSIAGTTNPLTDPAATPSNLQFGVPLVALSTT